MQSKSTFPFITQNEQSVVYESVSLYVGRSTVSAGSMEFSPDTSAGFLTSDLTGYLSFIGGKSRVLCMW